MSTLTRHGMSLMVESASEFDLERGLDAAKKVFDRAGVKPSDAWRAANEMEIHCAKRLDGKCGLPRETHERAALWVVAYDEALLACCGVGVPPPGADLSPAS